MADLLKVVIISYIFILANGFQDEVLGHHLVKRQFGNEANQDFRKIWAEVKAKRKQEREQLEKEKAAKEKLEKEKAEKEKAEKDTTTEEAAT